MHRDLRKQPGDGSDGSPPSKAWLFAQTLLGKPVPFQGRSRLARQEGQIGVAGPNLDKARKPIA